MLWEVFDLCDLSGLQHCSNNLEHLVNSPECALTKRGWRIFLHDLAANYHVDAMGAANFITLTWAWERSVAVEPWCTSCLARVCCPLPDLLAQLWRHCLSARGSCRWPAFISSVSDLGLGPTLVRLVRALSQWWIQICWIRMILDRYDHVRSVIILNYRS